ncbi:hypothetical protein [Providencia rettgeri]|uniref:Uncharacterized protein n=1 Tax=Providencia rettgeri TaxID=587 RepID=A0AAW6UNY3_PRORE|nr:hypothetical protein [Providencia rettgeri]MDI9094233.1 hypothetical protein [Providencia rettgeri]MDT2038508.1 hypothetical protein [Providencia rettgeri]
MLKTYRMTGYSVNPRGLTVGFNLNVRATDVAQAQTQLKSDFAAIGCTHIQITKVIEVVTYA